MDWAAAAAGLRNSRAEDTRKRQEMARAFAEYRAANPYATAAEFQDFIDRYSGGRNYISGGAPSASILRAIGMDNQKRKASDEMRQRLADIQTRQQTIQSLQSLADAALVGMEGDDFASVRDEVISQFGPDSADLLADFNVNSMFTPSRRQVLVSQKMRELLPGALDLARTTGGVLDAKAISGLYPDLPKPIIDSLVTEAERVREQEFAARKRELVAGALEFSRTNGSLLKSTDIASLYPGVPKTMIDPIVQEANRLRQKELDDEQRKIALDTANTKTQLRAALFQDPNFQAAVRSGDKVAALRIINETVKPYASAMPQGTFDQAFTTELLNQATQGAEQTQLTEHRALYQETRAKQNEAITKIESDSMAAVNLAFRASENGTPSMRAGGDALHNSNALFAAQQLATMFDTSQGGAIDILTNTFQIAAEDGASIEELTKAGAEALAAGGVPTLEASKQRAAMARGLNMPEMKSFPDWKVEIEDAIRQQTAKADKRIQEAARITDPEQLQVEIANIARAIEQTRNSFGGAIQDARINQNIWIPVGAQGWNDAQVFGKTNSVQATMDAEIDKLNQKLNALSQHAMYLTQRGQVAPQGNGFNAPPGSQVAPSATGTPPAPAGAATPWQRYSANAKLASEADGLLKQAADALYSGSSDLPAVGTIDSWREFFGEPTPDFYDKKFSYTGTDKLRPDEARTRAGTLLGYLRDPVAQQWAMQSKANMDLLRSNPVQAALALEDWIEKNGIQIGGGVALPRG